MKRIRGLTWGAFALWGVWGDLLSAANPPVLRLESLPEQRVRAAWTNTGQRVVLEETSSLADPIRWLPSPTPVTLDGGLYSAVIGFGEGARFYRLNDQGLNLTRFTSSPANGETGVAVTRETILSFTQPLAESTLLTTNNLSAEFGGRRILSRIELSSDRRKATLFYLEDLPASARIRVTFNAFNVADAFNRLVDADGDSVEGGVGVIEFDTLSITPVAGTAVIGRVFASQVVPNPTNAAQSVDLPLAGVTITVDGAEETLRTTTDASGFFRLAPSPAGRFFVHIDGRTATNGLPNSPLPWSERDYYPVVGKAWEAAPGQTNNLAAGTGEIYLPLVRAGTLQPVSLVHDTTIAFPAEVIAGNPALDGVHLVVPANSLFSDNGVRGGRVGIAPVPPDRIPEPLPPGLEMPIVITVQTDGPLNFDRPAPVHFPNLPDSLQRAPLPAGSKQSLYSFNHDKGIWEAVGSMTVSLDGRLVLSDPGTGILQPGWHGIGPIPFEPITCEEATRCEGSPTAAASPAARMFSDGLDGPIAAYPPPGKSGSSGCESDPCGPACYASSLLECINQVDERLELALAHCQFDFLTCCENAFQNNLPLKPCATARTRCTRRYTDENTNERLRCGIAAALGCFPSSSSLEASVGRLPAEEVVGHASLDAYALIAGNLDAIVALVDSVDSEPLPPEVLASIQELLAQANAAAGGSARDFLERRVLEAEAALQSARHLNRALGNAPDYPIPYLARAVRPLQPFELRGVTGAFGRYSIFVPRNAMLAEVLFYDPRTRHIASVRPYLSPAINRKLPRFTLEPLGDTDRDTDRDGLPDRVEEIFGTDIQIGDTDRDGLSDGVEVDQGTNPLDGRTGVTGVIAATDTTGTAMDVCAIDEVAVVADGSGGVVVFDAANPFQPVRAAVIPTPAPATAVACAGARAVVALGVSGLGVIDLTTPSTARLLYTLPAGGSARAVAVRAHTAFVGNANGVLAMVDLPTATVRQFLALGSRIDDLGLRGEHLFVATATELRGFRQGEQLATAGSVPLTGIADAATGRRRLFVGTTHALVTNLRGFDTIDVQNPSALVAGQSFDSLLAGFRQIVDNGSGLGVAAASVNAAADTLRGLFLYDISPATETPTFLTALPSPGSARAVSIFNGLAYLADGASGLQVVNYLSYDALGVPPTIEVATSFPLSNPSNGVAQAGQFVTVTAQVSDDVQVRHVEFYLDGLRVTTDGNFPFEQALLAPPLSAAKTNFALRVKATDTGGNFTWSSEILVQLVPDLSGPIVVARFPRPDSFQGAVDTVLVQFNEPLDPLTVSPAAFALTWAGDDQAFGTGDDQAVSLVTAAHRSADNSIALAFASGLAAGAYRVQVGPPITDLAGNAAQISFWSFRVLGTTDTDQDGVPDATELALGLAPDNPDSDGDGILDGDEDLDNDNLPTRWELQFNLNPALTDTDRNGTTDRNEDHDGDALLNVGELAAGTHPRDADTDDDGWNDEVEVTGGGNALHPAVIPSHGIAASPPARVLVLAPGLVEGLGPNSVLGHPPTRVLLLAPGSVEGLAPNSVVARPPVKVTIP